MSIKLSQLYVFSLYAALIGQACMFVGLPFEIGTFTTLGTYLIAGASLLSLGAWFISSDRKDDLNKILLVLLIIFVLFSLLYSWTFSYEILIRIITFLELPIFLMTAEKIKSKNAKKIIYAFNMLYPILFAVLFVSPISHRFVGEYGVIDHKNITLGYANPNEAGIYLLFNFIILFSALFKFRNPLAKIFCLAELGFVGYLVFLTDSRAAIVVIALVVVASLILKRVRFSPLILWITFAIPLFFFFALRWFPDLTILGESFDTGRSEIYVAVFEGLDFEKFILGDYESFALGNAHNALLSVFASLGIFCSVIFWTVFYRQISKLGKTVGFNERKVLLIGILAIIVHSSVEAAVLISGSAYATLFFTVYYLSVDDSETVKDALNENITR